MKVSRRQATIGGLSLLAGTSMSTVARAEFGEGLSNVGEGIEDFALAQDAYIYGYPLVTMEMTRRVITNVASPEGTRGPMGQIIKLRQYPNASFRDVTAPNADTLYTTAFFDVGKEPWVLSIPDMKDRYYLFPMLDGWTDVFQVPGKRTTGTGAQTYAITGPGWKGTLPSGRQGIQVADQHRLAAWPHLLHRHAGGLCSGPCAAGSGRAGATERLWQTIYAAQRHGRSVHRHENTRPRPSEPDGCDRVFHVTRTAHEVEPAAAADAPELAKFAKIGLVAGQDFDASKLECGFCKAHPGGRLRPDHASIQSQQSRQGHQWLGLYDQRPDFMAPTISCGRL